jgi:hypothetical protein
MARFTEPTAEQEAGWKEWVASRPEPVRKVAERFEPWSLYRMKSTGQRVTLYSFGEANDGSAVTLTVNVTGQFNAVAFDRQVFGIDPDDLEPCDLPAPTEPTGTALTDEADIKAYVDATRPAVLAARNKH